MARTGRLRAMKIRAAVLEEFGQPLVVQEVDLAEPEAGEVLVRLEACGVCHTDLYTASGADPTGYAPCVLGHEGAGIIEAVGADVDEARIGERVVLTFSPACGACRFCLEGRANLCLDAAAGLDSGFLRDGTTRHGREPGRHDILFHSVWRGRADYLLQPVE